jgi:uncharacterized protein YqgV (UPF0045/DUF77 family)
MKPAIAIELEAKLIQMSIHELAALIKSIHAELQARMAESNRLNSRIDDWLESEKRVNDALSSYSKQLEREAAACSGGEL